MGGLDTHAARLVATYEGWNGRALTDTGKATARMGILDILGCIVAGAQTPTAASVRGWALDQSGAGQAAALGTRSWLPVPLAALANGVAGHVLDFDDTNPTLTGHPSVVLVPALLALGQSRDLPGAALVEAYMLGFEIDCYFGRIMVPHHYDAGWHATASLGIFGAAAGCSHLLGLDGPGMLRALAIAASSVSGLRANFGSETKSLHAGQAAEGGVRAAMLAARGITANTGLFDAPDGFFHTYGANAQPKGPPPAGMLEIDDSRLGIKPYACCGAGLSVIDVVLDLRAAGLPPADEVVEIDCAVNAMAQLIMPLNQARNGLEGKYCIAYCAAVAYLDGQGGLAQFEDERVLRDDVQTLMQRVSVRVDTSLATGGGAFGVEIVVRGKDGSVRSLCTVLPRGHPGRPLSPAQLLQKFMDCATPVLGATRAAEVARTVGALEGLASLRDLAEQLQP